MKKKIEEKPDDVNELLNKVAAVTAVNKTTEDRPLTSNVEMASKVAETLFDLKSKAKKKMLGILHKDQIAGLKKIDLVNQIIFEGKNPVLLSIIDNEIFYSVAEKGKGREQLVQLTKVEDPTEQNMGRIKKYLG